MLKTLMGEIDTPGGHIVTCVVLVFVSILMYKLQVPKSEDVLLLSIGTLGRSMLGRNGKRTDDAPGK